MKKRVLCYGDSNTYGSIPGGGRYDENIRWPMVRKSCSATTISSLKKASAVAPPRTMTRWKAVIRAVCSIFLPV